MRRMKQERGGYGTLTIGDVARRSGVAVSAIRYYEERGLIASDRASSGHRRYPRSVLRRIAFIVFAQRIGLTLDEIAVELAKLPANREPADEDWAGLAATWMDRLEARIVELERLKRGLTECIGCGCLSISKCPLANPADRARTFGSGPRYWQGDPPADGSPSTTSPRTGPAPHPNPESPGRPVRR